MALSPGFVTASADELGPQSSSNTAPTLQLLQPADSSQAPLQSSDASGSGISPAQPNNLQQSGDSDQLKLMIQGEGDGPHSDDTGPNLIWLQYILVVLGLTTLGVALIWAWQRLNSA